jgi:hypothetical protein
MIEWDEKTHDAKLEATVQLHPMKSKYNFAARAAVLALALTAAFALNTSLRAQPPPGTIWYNGDFNGAGFHANEINTSSSNSQVFDDFIVTGGNWQITTIFSDNLLSTVVTGAVWEIRTGVTAGNEGVLVASGSTAAPLVTLTGRSGFGYTEYMVEVAGPLNVILAPGIYWLNVTPIGNGTGRSLNTTTSGANCVGTPCGNNGMSWFDPPGPIFSPLDFSMGVIVEHVPEPETWAMMAVGAGVLIVLRKLSRRKNA